MSKQTQKEKQPTLDETLISNRLAGLESRVEKAEEGLLKVETELDTVSAGQSIIYSALENAGLMKDGEPVQPASWDPNKIPWVQADGARGKYERYPRQGQAAESTEDYKAMLQDLKAHNGKMMREGRFYWLFTDGATVGRKLRKGKDAKPINNWW